MAQVVEPCVGVGGARRLIKEIGSRRMVLRVVREHRELFGNARSRPPRSLSSPPQSCVPRAGWRRYTRQVSHLGGLGNGPEMMT